ncbi:hypothetical protein [Variovorax sp. HW608]|uniref:hypothetical protein n=1 Tax=Variovorax sp. HW608 TaxID=1034889 RepID=UPI0012FE2214|nr:hypothetical protein [Variovorax sp. HW608]
MRQEFAPKSASGRVVISGQTGMAACPTVAQQMADAGFDVVRTGLNITTGPPS